MCKVILMSNSTTMEVDVVLWLSLNSVLYVEYTQGGGGG